MDRRWLAVLLLGSQAVGAPSSPGVSADVVVDATHQDGTFHVTMRWRGLPGSTQSLRPLASEAFTYTDVQVRDDAGVPVEHQVEAGAFTFAAERGFQVTYRVEPGGQGRHGMQGAIGSDWAVADGRVFMVPRGGVDPARITLRFEVPDGWSVAAPYPESDGGFVLEPDGAWTVDEQLTQGCFGLGNFERFAGEGYVGWAYAGWPQAHREQLQSGLASMVRWYAEQTGLDHPVHVVWTPGVERERVFGGAFGGGTCYEFPPDEDSQAVRRHWQLLGHRLAHPQNKYPPHTLILRDERDHWFLEGWAAYSEVIATEAVGLATGESYLAKLDRRRRTLLASRPEFTMALADEPRVPAEMQEYVHYTLAPLVVAQLDAWLKERSGTSVAAFVRSLNEQHGDMRGTVDLRAALDRFTGDDYADFWALYVDRATDLPPVWTRPKAAHDPIATAAGVPVDAELLVELALRHERFEHARDTLIAAERRLADLDRRGVRWLPAAFVQNRRALAGPGHAALLSTALAYPLHLAPSPPNRGCSGPTPLPEPSFVVDPASPRGLLFDRLLQAERDEVRVGVERVAVRLSEARPAGILVVGDEDDLQLMVKWIAAPGAMTVELLQDGEPTFTKELLLEPTWRRTWTSFPAGNRRKGESMLTFRVSDANGVRVTRSIWQIPGSIGSVE